MSWYTTLTLGQVDAPPAPPTAQPGPAPAGGAAPGGTTAVPGSPAAAPGGNGKGAEQPPGSFNFLFMMVLFLGVFWVLIMLPQRREKKKREAMMSAMKKGDKVQTIGGVIGTIADIRDQEVVLKVDESSNTRMRFTRSAIAAVLGDEPASK